MEIQANTMAAYVGVVALFRNHTGDSWRKIIPLKGKNPKIGLSLRDHSIEIVSVN